MISFAQELIWATYANCWKSENDSAPTQTGWVVSQSLAALGWLLSVLPFPGCLCCDLQPVFTRLCSTEQSLSLSEYWAEVYWDHGKHQRDKLNVLYTPALVLAKSQCSMIGKGWVLILNIGVTQRAYDNERMDSKLTSAAVIADRTCKVSHAWWCEVHNGRSSRGHSSDQYSSWGIVGSRTSIAQYLIHRVLPLPVESHWSTNRDGDWIVSSWTEEQNKELHSQSDPTLIINNCLRNFLLAMIQTWYDRMHYSSWHRASTDKSRSVLELSTILLT